MALNGLGYFVLMCR